MGLEEMKRSLHIVSLVVVGALYLVGEVAPAAQVCAIGKHCAPVKQLGTAPIGGAKIGGAKVGGAKVGGAKVGNATGGAGGDNVKGTKLAPARTPLPLPGVKKPRSAGK